MADRPGLWIVVAGGRRAEKVSWRIEQDDTFTTVVDVSKISPRRAELVLVSLASIDGPTVDYLGIAQAGRRVATDQQTVLISSLVELDRIPVREVRRALLPRHAARMPDVQDGAVRPGAKTWQAILNAVLQLRPRARSHLESLRQRIAETSARPTIGNSDLEAFERDAIASALEAWGGTKLRKRVMRSAATARGAEPASFLRRLREVTILEETALEHDYNVFPGLSVARRYRVGAVELQGDDDRLTIINCNRRPLERTLGVDLIYYNHRYDSFVLVQYKRMHRKSRGEAVYRPAADQNHDSELRRMLRATKLLGTVRTPPRSGLHYLRLSDRPFFFKLCEAKVPRALDAGMVPGMYIPLQMWRMLLRHDAVRGPRGGVAIGWHNCPRRLSNGAFTMLLRHGWIGSAAGHSSRLAQIIEDVLESGRMLVYAVSSSTSLGRDYRRDEHGQFAPDDDPIASM